jgi:hypothetical protein
MFCGKRKCFCFHNIVSMLALCLHAYVIIYRYLQYENQNRYKWGNNGVNHLRLQRRHHFKKNRF